MKVLFVCVGNTCRSVLAEYIGRFRCKVEAASAGLKPQPAADAMSAIKTLNDIGIDASQHVPRNVESIDPEGFDYVVAMEPGVAKSFAEKFPSFPAGRLRKWNIKDPWDDPGAYSGCAKQIHRKLMEFLRSHGA